MKNSLKSRGMVLLGLILDTKAQVFSNIFRFTDDLDTLKNEFENNYSDKMKIHEKLSFWIVQQKSLIEHLLLCVLKEIPFAFMFMHVYATYHLKHYVSVSSEILCIATII